MYVHQLNFHNQIQWCVGRCFTMVWEGGGERREEGGGGGGTTSLEYMRKGLGVFLENCEKPAATRD